MKNLPAELKKVIQENKDVLKVSKSQEIAAPYATYLQEVSQAGVLVANLSPEDPQHIEQARRIRIDLGHTVGAVSRIKKEQKAELLLETRLIDSCYNIVESAARLTQNEATKIEKHFELKQKEQEDKLHSEREKLLQPFNHDSEGINFGKMTDNTWDLYFKGVKAQHEEEIQEEKRREKREQEERQAMERKAKEAEAELKKRKKAEGRLQKLLEVGITTNVNHILEWTQKQFDEAYKAAKEEYEKEQVLISRKASLIKLEHINHEQYFEAAEQNNDKEWKVMFDDLSKLNEKIAKQIEDRTNQLVDLEFEPTPFGFENYYTGQVVMLGKLKVQNEEWLEILEQHEKRKQDADAKVEAQRQLEKLAKEREAKEKAEAEAKRKAEEAEKARQLAPDKEKLELFLESLLQLEAPELSTPEAQQVMENINKLIIKIEVYATEKISQL